MAELKKTYSLPNSSLARQFGLSYTTLMRWKRRLTMGQPTVGKPGPKKVRSFNLGQLRQKIRDLDHGKKRSHGTGRLHDAFSGAISRRELNRMISIVRNENNLTLRTSYMSNVFGDDDLDNSVIRIQFVYAWHRLMENMKKLQHGN